MKVTLDIDPNDQGQCGIAVIDSTGEQYAKVWSGDADLALRMAIPYIAVLVDEGTPR